MMDDAMIEAVAKPIWELGAASDLTVEECQNLARTAIPIIAAMVLGMAAEEAEGYPSSEWADIAVIRGCATAIRALKERFV